MSLSVRAHVCVRGCVYVWLYVYCMITVGVLVFVSSCVWLFLLDFTALSSIHTSRIYTFVSSFIDVFSPIYFCIFESP